MITGKRMLCLVLSIALVFLMAIGAAAAAEDDVRLSDDASGFVLLSEAVPDAILEIRYYSTYNFVGDRIDGYEEPLAFLTREAAAALREVSDELLEQGYRLKIFDAYRPQMAVTHFMNWALDTDDVRMKEYFYPELDKDVLFPQGYIAEHSGHSRGSTVDLTLFDMTAEKEVDMGGTFDYFGELSHPDYTGITEEQYANRMILREAMLAHGFRPLEEEWWHFTLEDEPYPDTYFTFPVNSDSLPENPVFAYENDPRDNPRAMEDIVENPDAVYGFSPDPDSTRLGAYADAIDWSDPEQVADARAQREEYHESMSELYGMIETMLGEGKNVEEIARAVSGRRNELRLEVYADDPEGLELAKQSNLETYGDENGPSADSLYEKYGSWQTVLEKALSTNMGMDACLGLYDEYYYTYIGVDGWPQTTDAGGVLSGIRASGVLRVGTTGDYKPMSYLDPETGEYWGFDTALTEDLAAALGVEIEYVPTSWPTLMEDTLAGRFDLAVCGITVTDARQEQALMSDGYLGNGKTVLCRAEDAEVYTSLEAINRPEVRVMENPGGLNEKFARENLPDAELIIHDVNEEIPGLVAAGEADVMITEILEAGYYVGQDDRLAAPLIYEPFTQGQLGILMAKGSEDLLDFVNRFLAEERESGRLDELAQEYIYRYIADELDQAA